VALSANKLENYTQEIDLHYRRNVWGVMIDNAMFNIISVCMSQYTILPLYLSKLTDSEILIGLIPTVSIVGFALPQLFIARFLEGKRRKKKYIVLVAAIQRISILAFLILTLIQSKLSASLTIILFFLIYIIQNLLAGCWFPLWVDFVGHAIPRNRGKMFGLSTLIGGIISLAVGSLITYLLGTLSYPQAISGAAAIAFIGSLVSMAAIIAWHEAVPPEDDGVPGALVQESSYFQSIKKDKNFQSYLAWRGVMIGIEMALPFLTISAINQLQVSDTQVGIFSIILSVSNSLTNLFWGWLGDRIGFLRVVLISTVLGALGIILAASTVSLSFVYLVFVCAGAMLSGQQLTSINIIYEFGKRDQILTYTAIHQIVLSPISGIMPVFGGLIAGAFGYKVLFWVASFFGLAGSFGMSTKVKNQFRNIPISVRETNKENH